MSFPSSPATRCGCSAPRRSAKSPTPGWAGPTCWPSGSASPTRSPRISSAGPRWTRSLRATQALAGPGDRVVEVTPLWPNLVEIPKILGAQVQCVALRFTPQGWRLDLDELLAALTPGTRAVYINSPNNPTGWALGA